MSRNDNMRGMKAEPENAKPDPEPAKIADCVCGGYRVNGDVLEVREFQHGDDMTGWFEDKFKAGVPREPKAKAEFYKRMRLAMNKED